MTPSDNSTSLDKLFNDTSVADRLRETAPAAHSAASRYWAEVFDGGTLSARFKELVLLALHASATSTNAEAIRRHVGRALEAGASAEEIVEVLISIVGVSTHSLYSALPVLHEALREMGQEVPGPAELAPEVEDVKAEFIRTRGFWNEQRELLARSVPRYFRALSELSMEPAKSGVLGAKERELIYIAIDCSVTHMYAPGLALHTRRALELGTAPGEILEVFQLAALMGLEGYILGVEALFGA
jgi:alkylhydroperoxidase/carboxymuconolactone decarboxylase family protein YurZ